MYAIVEIAGQQFKVSKNQRVYVHRLEANEGDNVEFSNVMLIGDGDKITVGAPNVAGAKVAAKVLTHLKGDKVIVFKKKRRKGYQKSNGHRQQFSQIVVQAILTNGASLSAADDVAVTVAPVRKTTTPKVKEMKVAVAAEAKPKKAPAKKAAAKKKAE